MKRKLSKVLAIAMMLALVMSIASLGALAATTTAYTATANDKTSFNKYLVVESGSSVPNVSFSYTIAAGTKIDATDDTMAVIAGPVIEESGSITAPSVQQAEFTNNSATQTGADDVIPTALKGLTYATDEVEINFAGVSFPEPGVYRYVLTEQAMVSPYTALDSSVRYLDVYVINDTENAGQLKIASYALHTDDAAPAADQTNGGSADVTTENDPLDSKSDGYINQYKTIDLSFSKEITGNQAAKDKYFAFNVQLTNVDTETNKAAVADTDVFVVDLSGAEASPAENAATVYENMSNPATVTGKQLKDGITFYLNDQQHITIKDLPVGISYSVTEVAEDYRSTANNNIVAIAAVEADPAADPPVEAVAEKKYDDANTGTLSVDKYVGYTNTRNGIIPTGVIITVAPFVIGILVFGAIILYMINRRKRAEY